MDKKELLKNFLDALDDESDIKAIFRFLDETNSLNDDIIRWMITEIWKLAKNESDINKQKKIESARKYLISLKSTELEEHKRETQSWNILLWYEYNNI